MAALLNSAMISLDAVLASVASTSWENVVQVDMEPSNKAEFLMASMLNTISGITILVSLQYFLVRRFTWKVKMGDADRRLEEAERPLMKLYGVSFLSVLFKSWAMAIANLLTSFVIDFWVWIALSRGVNLKDEIRNTCSHVGYSEWLTVMNVWYSICISIVIAWLGTKIRVWNMRIQDKAWATTLEISSKGLGDTAGWVLWSSGDFIFACLPKDISSSWKAQIPRFVILGGFSAIMFMYIDSSNMKDYLLLGKDKDNDDNTHHHHPKWDEEGENGCPTIEEEDDMDPNRERADNGHKKQLSISIRFVWISLIQEALLIIFALTFVSAYYIPLEYELGKNVHPWSLGIACILTISLTYLHWYCGIHLGGHYPRSGVKYLNVCHFVMELCPWIVSFAWMYLLEGWLHDNEWSANLIFAICVTLFVSIFMYGVMNYANRYLHSTGFAEKSWLFGVAANDFQTSLIEYRP